MGHLRMLRRCDVSMPRKIPLATAQRSRLNCRCRLIDPRSHAARTGEKPHEQRPQPSPTRAPTITLPSEDFMLARARRRALLEAADDALLAGQPGLAEALVHLARVDAQRDAA